MVLRLSDACMLYRSKPVFVLTADGFLLAQSLYQLCED